MIMGNIIRRMSDDSSASIHVNDVFISIAPESASNVIARILNISISLSKETRISDIYDYLFLKMS